jgi:hypothetical protein
MPHAALQARYFDENAGTRSCADITRTLGMLPGRVKNFVSTERGLFIFKNHIVV